MLIKNYKLDSAGNGQQFLCKKIIYEAQSKYQKIQIADLDIVGRVLVLDDIIQLSELDCDVYHESFAHIPMCFVQKPSKVLVLGGGDGILAKELLKYENVKIDLVDIDKQVCDASKTYLQKLNAGALNHPRVNVFNTDAYKYCVSKEDNTYDAIFGDITDPHPDSPSKSLLSDSALSTYKRVLTDNGVLAIQTDNVQIAPNHVRLVSKQLGQKFKNLHNFSIVATTLGGLFSFVMATNTSAKRSQIAVKTNWLNEQRVKTNFLLNNYLTQGL